MKKFLALFLALLMLVSVLAGCDKPAASDKERPMPGGSSSSSSDKKDPKDTEPEETKPADVDFEETAPEDDDEPFVPDGNAALDEMVIFDQDGVKITTKGITQDSWSTEIKFLVENNTEQNIVFTGDDAVINGITVPVFLYIQVNAGKKSNSSMTLYTETLAELNIKDIATIAVPEAEILDYDSYDQIAAAPFSLSTSIADTYKQEIDTSGEELLKEDGITVLTQGLTMNEYGATLHLLVINDSSYDLIAMTNDTAINDFVISGFMFDRVYSGTVAYCTMEIYESELEENDITDIETISFSLEFVDLHNYDPILETEEFNLAAE